jgi:single-strand DNA-binding protein
MSLYASGVVRIISDLESRSFESGTNVVKFGGGLNEGKDRNGDYIKNAIDCEAWGKTADVITRFMDNGSSFFASGRILQQRWQDREGGNRSKHVFTIDRVELLPRSGEAVNNGAPAAAPAASSESPFGGDHDPIDDEIPF